MRGTSHHTGAQPKSISANEALEKLAAIRAASGARVDTRVLRIPFCIPHRNISFAWPHCKAEGKYGEDEMATNPNKTKGLKGGDTNLGSGPLS